MCPLRGSAVASVVTAIAGVHWRNAATVWPGMGRTRHPSVEQPHCPIDVHLGNQRCLSTSAK